MPPQTPLTLEELTKFQGMADRGELDEGQKANLKIVLDSMLGGEAATPPSGPLTRGLQPTGTHARQQGSPLGQQGVPLTPEGEPFLPPPFIAETPTPGGRTTPSLAGPALDAPGALSAPPPARGDFATGQPLVGAAEQGLSQAERTQTLQEQPGELLGALGQGLAEAHDPRTREGQLNLAATIGSIALTKNVSAPLTAVMKTKRLTNLQRVWRLTAPAVGAGGAATATSGVQRLIDPPPASRAAEFLGIDENPTAQALLDGVIEAGYDVGGTLLPWPIRAWKKRAIARDVSLNAIEGLAKVNRTRVTILESALDATGRLVDQVNEGARVRGLEITDQGAALQGAARTHGEVGIRQATEAAQASRAGLETQLGSVPPGRIPTESGQAVVDTFAKGGPVRSVKDDLGEAVGAAADAAPDFSMVETQAFANQMFEEEIQDLATLFSGRAATGAAPVGTGTMSGVDLNKSLALALKNGASDDLIATLRAQGAGDDLITATIESAKAPGMDIIRKIVNSPETVPFATAHRFKQALRDGLTETDLTTTVRGATKSRTKAFLGHVADGLNDADDAYADANAAFEAVASMMGKGTIAADVQRLALTEPQAVLQLIDPEKPTQVRFLRELLLNVSAQAGEEGGRQGQAAWDLVRQTWTTQHILEGGLDGLGKNLDDLGALGQREFAEIFYGDASGQATFERLHRIRTAYDTAVASGQAQLDTAKASAAELTEQVTQATKAATRRNDDVRRATLGPLTETQREQRQHLKDFVREPGGQERDLSRSTLARMQTMEEQAADATRAFGLQLGQTWQLISTFRLFRGPRTDDLLRWSMLSDEATEATVEALSTVRGGPTRGISALLRMPGFAEYFTSPDQPTAGESVERAQRIVQGIGEHVPDFSFQNQVNAVDQGALARPSQLSAAPAGPEPAP